MVKIATRLACSSDIDWISRVLIEGAGLGHFSGNVGTQSLALLHQVLSSGKLTMLKLRDSVITEVAIDAEIRVAEIETSPAGFLLTLIDHDEVELHLAGTRRAFRRKGCFAELVQDQIRNFHPTKRLFARCYRKSTWAMDALRQQGFEVTKDGDPVELTYNPKSRSHRSQGGQ